MNLLPHNKTAYEAVKLHLETSNRTCVIHPTGTGKSIYARFLHTNTAVHGDLGMVGKNDIVYLLSKGGNTHETVALAEHLKARGTDTWLMTFTEKCKSAEVVDKRMIMHLINEGDEWDIVPNNSTTVYLIVLQGIALEIASRLGVTLDDFRVNHPGGGIGARLSGKDLW